MAIRLETSKGKGIENYQDTEISTMQLDWCSRIGMDHPMAKSRTEPSPTYNCHGLTFASRRTRIIKSSALRAILEDDNYREIPFRDVLPGDIVIYYSESGDPNHSGVVVDFGEPLAVPMVCSKWGNAGEFVHALRHCPDLYGPLYKFYRCIR